jgi:hypothetical protein
MNISFVCSELLPSLRHHLAGVDYESMGQRACHDVLSMFPNIAIVIKLFLPEAGAQIEALSFPSIFLDYKSRLLVSLSKRIGPPICFHTQTYIHTA